MILDPESKEVLIPVPKEYNVFAYVISGKDLWKR